MELLGRRRERDELERFIHAVRDGESRALVVCGEAGMGKTALLDHVADHAAGCRLVRAAGVQSEMELAFAGLHQLCAPMLDRLDQLPPPQADAVRIAFGITAGTAPDRFVVGLAVLNLLSDVAEEQPLVCLIDDEQWLDRASAQVLSFVARRLGAESVGLILGTCRVADRSQRRRWTAGRGRRRGAEPKVERQRRVDSRRGPRQHHALLAHEPGVSASRLYWEYQGGFFNAKGVSIPVAVSVFPSEQYQAPRSWAERAYPNLIHYNQVEKGGHFAAWEQPELFSKEVRDAFRSLR